MPQKKWKWLLAFAAVILAVTGALPAFAGVPDVSQSYYVPTAGFGGTLVEGVSAIANFRGCPDNDGTTVLAKNSRLKVVVLASDGSPIANIPAADICMLFNGGTPAQGFSGAGDDSIIANFQYNPAANCPDVRCIQADAPTDVTGTTYITLIGVSGVRDPLRKWGGWAGDVPVMVLGFKLQGKLTSGSGLGTYTAHVKSADQQGGRTVTANQGELVNSLDIFAVKGYISTATYNYSVDYQQDGVINVIDYNYARGHISHNCNTPLAN